MILLSFNLNITVSSYYNSFYSKCVMMIQKATDRGKDCLESFETGEDQWLPLQEDLYLFYDSWRSQLVTSCRSLAYYLLLFLNCSSRYPCRLRSLCRLHSLLVLYKSVLLCLKIKNKDVKEKKKLNAFYVSFSSRWVLL